MSATELFALLIVNSVIAFVTACAVFAVALIGTVVIGNPRPMLWSLFGGGAVFVAVLFTKTIDGILCRIDCKG